MIHSFCHGFDADVVIQGMMSGNHWPRAAYLKDEVSASALCRLCLLDSRLLELFSRQPRDEPRISSVLRGLWKTGEAREDIT